MKLVFLSNYFLNLSDECSIKVNSILNKLNIVLIIQDLQDEIEKHRELYLSLNRCHLL